LKKLPLIKAEEEGAMGFRFAHNNFNVLDLEKSVTTWGKTSST
jgi:hypothetical protein